MIFFTQLSLNDNLYNIANRQVFTGNALSHVSQKVSQLIYPKQVAITFIVSIKVITSKVFGKRGVGERTFFQKGFSPAPPMR